MSDAHGSKGGLPFYSVVDGLLHNAHGNSIHISIQQLVGAFVLSIAVFFLFEPAQTVNNFQLLVFLSPIWIPIILFQSVLTRFIQANRAAFFAKQQYILLEIRIPREVTKTPLAMETFLANLHIGSGEANWYSKYILGSTRPTWSLELVSLGGRVHMYIWTRAGFRRLIESFLYAQYPDIEIIEAEDYSRLVDPSEHGYGMFAAEFTYPASKPFADAFSLKTYVDYKMEPGNKPEESVDPMAQMIELMGSIGPGEQFWMQFIIRVTKGEKFVGQKNAEGKDYKFADMVTEAIDSIRKKTVRKTSFTDPVTGKVTESEGFPNPTKGQSDAISTIERKGNKQVYDVGIRSIYLGTDAAFQGSMIGGQLSIFKPFNNEAGVGLNPASRFGAMFNGFPWEDRSGHHKHHLNQLAVQVYRRRCFFFDPYVGLWNIMSTEELATIFHVPSSAVTTPNLPRIQSATSGAPPNLPG